jgi:drug/metabolite transporter (DMT)-like permease
MICAMNLHTTTGKWKLGAALAFLTALIWGITPIALNALLDTMDFYTVGMYRFLLSAAILMIVVPAKYGKPTLRNIRPQFIILLVVAIAGLFGNYTLFMVGLDFLPPSSVAVIMQTAPLFLLAGGIIVFKENYSKYQFIGLFVLISGLFLFFNQKLFEVFSQINDFNLGVLVVLASATLWAIYALSQKQLLKTLPSNTVLLIVYLGCMLLFLPLSTPKALFELDLISLILLIYCALTTIVAYGLFSESLNHLEASRVSAVLAAVPLLTIFFEIILAKLFPETIAHNPLNALSILGACMVVTGSMVSSLSGKIKS